uniref:Uncharacterized protein n=1 Tax=uncultured Desulfobacterium sp. TaxID=201089 RepID=E1YJV2_9BACT|nr:unknown protein [uncultured Desulfobacterium sp.]
MKQYHNFIFMTNFLFPAKMRNFQANFVETQCFAFLQGSKI